jgi:hypothetical protein
MARGASVTFGVAPSGQLAGMPSLWAIPWAGPRTPARVAITSSDLSTRGGVVERTTEASMDEVID